MDSQSGNDGEGKSAAWGDEVVCGGINLFDCGKPSVMNLKTAGTLVCMLFRRVDKCV
jgi:hypothetical protein